ncbi:hypothetical protein AAG570_004501 [Ranatra chinensis]|uniref:Uncharacterized protein n=1 Tax=Ranatra chinensis TaxID=642074 RepID=A0ABD0Y113_9HEMI
MEMKTSQDSSVTSTEKSLPLYPEKTSASYPANSLVSRLIESALEQDANSNKANNGSGNERSGGGITTSQASPSPTIEESRLSKTFPWLTQFNKLCQAEIGSTDINTLENLMTVYLHHVGSCVSDCYLKPNRAAKLKRCMNDTLLIFHMFYSDIKKPLEHSSYLDKMSDLMAMYMDMEIKASSRVLRDSPGRAVYEMTYVRYVLVFKMWKRVVRGAEERRNVMKLATMKLHPPSQFREKLKAGLLSGVLPKIPKSRKDITMFLMQAKFCIREKTKAFLKAVVDPKQQGVLGSQLAADLDRPLFFGDDADTSRNSNSDEQEDTSGSSMLMNDIWSSMTLESGISDHLRLASVVTTKSKKQVKNKSRKNVIKCKGIATPVFKTDPGVTDNGVASEKCKKKKKKQPPQQQPQQESEDPKDKVDKNKSQNIIALEKSSEVTEVTKPPTEPVAVEKKDEIEVCSSEDVSKPKDIAPKPTNQFPVAEKTSSEVQSATVTNEVSVSVSNIKLEPESDDVCIIGFVNSKDKEQVNQVDSVCQGDKENEMLEVAEEVEIRCDTDNVAAEPSATDIPCQQAVVSSVKVENSAPPAENAEGQSSHACDVLLYDEQTPSVWSPAHPQGYYNNTDNDFINEYLVHTKLPDFDIDSEVNDMEQHYINEILEMNKSLNIRPKENLFPMRGDNVLGDLSSIPIEDEVSDANRNQAYASHSGSGPDTRGAFIQRQMPPQGDMDLDPYHLVEQPESNHELINKFLMSLDEQDRNSNKTQMKNQKVAARVSKVVAEVQAKSKEKGMLHDRTLRRDHSIFMSQQKFRSFYITQNIPPATPVPSPVEFDQNSMRPIPRCHCPQCYANQIALITNYRILTQYKNSKINSDAALRKSQNEELLKKIEESLKEKVIKDESNEQDSSLPLKKRKAFTCNPLKKEVAEPSYPCTPMISIAALEENKNNLKTMNFEAKLHTGAVPMDYTVANTSTYAGGYARAPSSEQPAIKPYNTVIVQNSKPKQIVGNVVSGSYTPFHPGVVHSDDKIRFKTPAQLKEVFLKGQLTSLLLKVAKRIMGIKKLRNNLRCLLRIARSSRRLPKRSLNKKDAVEEEVFAVDTKTKRRVKKKKSGDLIRMVSADDWIKYDPPYGPLTRSRMCNMPSSKTDTKLRKRSCLDRIWNSPHQYSSDMNYNPDSSAGDGD